MKCCFKKLFVLLFFLLFTFSCDKNIKNVDLYPIVDVRSVIDENSSLDLAKEITGFEYIQLEESENDESLIGEIIDYAITSKYIYILPTQEPRIVQFDRKNGRFIKTLIKSGPSPGEFNGMISGIQADEKNNKLYLFGSMIWVYTLDGDFLEHYAIGNIPIMFERRIGNRFAAVSMAFMPFQKGSFGIGVLSNSGEVLFNKNDFYTDLVPAEQTGFTANISATLSQDARSILFKTGSNDTVFRVTQDSISVACVLKLNNSDEEIIRCSDISDFSDISGLRRSSRDIYVQDIFETYNNYYFRCRYNNGISIVSVNKKTGRVLSEKCFMPSSLQELSKTTLLHGLLGSKSYNNFPIYGRCFENELIQVITPSELSLYKFSRHIDVPDFLSKIGEEGNPIFIFYKLLIN